MRPEAMARIGRTAARIKQIFGAYDGDAMPKSLIVGGLFLTVAALFVGVALGWEGLLSNVSANLVILGPGLLITNMLVAAWRDERVARQIEPVVGFILTELVDSLHAVTRFLEATGSNLAKEVKKYSSDEFISSLQLVSVRNELEKSYSLIMASKRSQLSGVRVTPSLLKVADMTLVERFISHFSGLRPAADALMAASAGAHWFENYLFKFSVETSLESGVTNLTTGAVRGYRNFHGIAFSDWPEHSAGREQSIIAEADSYREFLSVNLMLSVQIIDSLYRVLPRATSEQIGKLELSSLSFISRVRLR